MKFIKKPIAIEAVQWFKDGDSPAVKLCDHDTYLKLSGGADNPDWASFGVCGTLEGLHLVTPSDWIIKGVDGEYYPCKEDIFYRTYEKAGE